MREKQKKLFYDLLQKTWGKFGDKSVKFSGYDLDNYPVRDLCFLYKTLDDQIVNYHNYSSRFSNHPREMLKLISNTITSKMIQLGGTFLDETHMKALGYTRND